MLLVTVTAAPIEKIAPPLLAAEFPLIVLLVIVVVEPSVRIAPPYRRAELLLIVLSVTVTAPLSRFNCTVKSGVSEDGAANNGDSA